jgi:hypothetical protein
MTRSLDEGEVATDIPALADQDPAKFAISVCTVRVFRQKFTSRMPLDACDQWHSSRTFTLLPVDTGNCVATLKALLTANAFHLATTRISFVCKRTVLVFREEFTLEDAIGSLACSASV